MIQTNNTPSRQTLRQRRQAISPSERIQRDADISQHLHNCALALRCRHIAGYLANDGEPSNDAFIKRCWQQDRAYYLPIVKNKTLLFARYKPNEPLVSNKYSIKEPLPSILLPAKFLSAILVPLVGYDLKGNRLGMGGGFYDRALSFVRRLPCQKRPLLIGIAYGCQRVKHINKQPWDVPLDAVINEKGLLCFNNKSYGLLRKNQ